MTTRKRATGKVTLADVARLAQVSPMTASRALRGLDRVAKDMVDRVQQAASQLGYVPDPAARALASQRSHHVAVLIPMLSNNLFVDVLEAIQKTLRPMGYQTLIGITHYNPLEEEQLLREQLQNRPAGILVSGLEQNANTRQMMAASALPCVHMMELSPETNTCCVGFSQTEAASTLTRHLIGRGDQRIMFVGSPLDSRPLQRREGRRDSMQSAGVFSPELELLDPSPSSMQLGYQMLGHISQSHPDVDAVFFCNDDLAQGALLYAQSHGLRVPQDVAIAGFNDLTGSELMSPPLTTIRTPREAIGTRAAQMLVQLIEGTDLPDNQIDVGYELMVRQST